MNAGPNDRLSAAFCAGVKAQLARPGCLWSVVVMLLSLLGQGVLLAASHAGRDGWPKKLNQLLAWSRLYVTPYLYMLACNLGISVRLCLVCSPVLLIC